MTAERDAILERLAQSRAEIRRLLEPAPRESAEEHPSPDAAPRGFPRSRTMRMLMKGRGLGVLAALAGGLIIARPAVAWRLIRSLPTGTVARLLITRILAGMRETPR
jgi:hypothetical protein